MIKSRLTIAVVDDEPAVRKALRRLFRSAGLEVESFADGLEVVTSLKRNPVDCLVLDLHMPGLSGLNVLHQLGAAGVRVPTIVITGHDQPEVEAQVRAAGAAAYLNKPLDEHTLLSAVTEAVRGADEPRALPQTQTQTHDL